MSCQEVLLHHMTSCEHHVTCCEGRWDLCGVRFCLLWWRGDWFMTLGDPSLGGKFLGRLSWMEGSGGIRDMGARILLAEEGLCTLRGELDAAIWIMLDIGLRCNCCVFLECAKRAELIPDGDTLPTLPLPPPILTPFAAAASRFADSACPTCCCCCCGNTTCRLGNPLSVRCELGGEEAAEAVLFASQRAAFCCIMCLCSSGSTMLCIWWRCTGLVPRGGGGGGGGRAWLNVNAGCCCCWWWWWWWCCCCCGRWWWEGERAELWDTPSVPSGERRINIIIFVWGKITGNVREAARLAVGKVHAYTCMYMYMYM